MGGSSEKQYTNKSDFLSDQAVWYLTANEGQGL